ncbi:hypothetical protein Zmor_011760 [Zophobas morio]|uniref:PEP5/VPS11 N-terminal domain-containing protein n=1 Tax=Zophobas morio TaxID=2755281 RepID=A0AA38HH09_9CUCU|nr:hypothetical protein Zmor_011760 [Zophobas morio]
MLQWNRLAFFDKHFLLDSINKAFEFSEAFLAKEVSKVVKAPSIKTGSSLKKGYFSESKSVTSSIKEVKLTAFDVNQLKVANISGMYGGEAFIVFGDASGLIYIMNKNSYISAFTGFNYCLTHIKVLSKDLILAIGYDEPAPKPWLLRFWKFGQFIICQSLYYLSYMFVTAFSILNISLMAFGFNDGSLLILFGDVTKKKKLTEKIISESSSPVTGLVFQQKNLHLLLFVVTSDSVSCVELTDDKNLKICVHHYDESGKKATTCFEGPIKMLHWFGSYLLVVAPKDEQTDLVTLCDLDNKIIVYSGVFPLVSFVTTAWGSLYLLVNDEHKLATLIEKDIHTKLELLFRKHLYAIAVKMATDHGLREATVADIHKRYGDHLFSKGEFNRAVDQYLRTVGIVEPSYVLRKFLDENHLPHMIRYLQRLHEGASSQEGNERSLRGLLLPVFSLFALFIFERRGRVGTIYKGIYAASCRLELITLGLCQTNTHLALNVESAFTALRQAGYVQQAVLLSKKYRRDDLYIKIIIEDQHDYVGALRHMEILSVEEAVACMRAYGKTLVENIPQETTTLLKFICTGQWPVIYCTKTNRYETKSSVSTSSETVQGLNEL